MTGSCPYGGDVGVDVVTQRKCYANVCTSDVSAVAHESDLHGASVP